MKHTLSFALVGFILSAAPLAAGTDCLQLAASVKATIQNAPEQSLAVVAKEVAAAPNCACDIVKAAIQAASADAELVAAIVETAAKAAPEHMRMIAQCAIAVAPDSLAGVQSVLAKLDPNSGDGTVVTSAKTTAKMPVVPVADTPNPLDFPGANDPTNTVGPQDGLTGGFIPGGPSTPEGIFPGVPPFFFPTVPVSETQVNP